MGIISANLKIYCLTGIQALNLYNFAAFEVRFIKSAARRFDFYTQKIMWLKLIFCVLASCSFENEKMEIIWNKQGTDVLGEDNPLGVTGIQIKDTLSNELSEINCSGVFVAIGHSPASALIKDQLKTFDSGYVSTLPGTTKTSIPGVFAAGDLVDNVYRQAVTSAAMGCMAALDAEKYLSEIINGN